MKKILAILVAVGTAFNLTGCLNDDEHYVDFQGAGAIAEIPSSAFYGIADNQSFLSSSTPTSYSFNVNIASPNLPSQDVQLALGINQSALTTYNNQNGTAYTLPTAGTYQITTPSVTVKAGTRMAPVTVQINTGSIKPTDQFAIPVSITSATGGVTVSGNYATKIIFIKLRNNYEGSYQATGTFTHPTAGARAINEQKTLQTIDLTTSETNFADLGGSGWTMWLKVNADNTVTLTPKGSSSTATTQFGENRYDPATRTFILNYKYPGSGGDRVVNERIRRL
nr:DUF4361 domain-containing protein [uncultured Arsenicibacter sp.]